MSYIATEFHPIFKSQGEIVNTPGPIKPADVDMDPASQMNADTGLDLSSVDYAPKFMFRSVVIRGGALGQSSKVLRTYYKTGTYFDWPVDIAAKGVMEIEGEFVGIDHTTTDATLVFPFL